LTTADAPGLRGELTAKTVRLGPFGAWFGLVSGANLPDHH
jgi:hypothetical protein